MLIFFLRITQYPVYTYLLRINPKDLFIQARNPFRNGFFSSTDIVPYTSFQDKMFYSSL